MPGGIPRRPRLEISDAHKAGMVETLERLGIPAIEGW
jgi:hypothetical protein